MYAFVDIETTGLDPDEHDVLEVGVVLEEPETTIEEVHFSLAVDLRLADPSALAINQAVERQAELEAIRMERAHAALLLSTKLEAAVFIGNNPAFDQAFLRKFLAEHGLEPSWKYHVVDVKALAGMALGLKPTWSTGRLLASLGMEDHVAHTALADAYQARDIFYAAYKHREQGVVLP
jgi:DNA polymerase III alpha subunit (gram-positive type)